MKKSTAIILGILIWPLSAAVGLLLFWVFSVWGRTISDIYITKEEIGFALGFTAGWSVPLWMICRLTDAIRRRYYRNKDIRIGTDD